MVSHTGVAYVKLQHPETVIVVVAILGGGHVVHVGELEHVVHVGHVVGVGHVMGVGELHVGWLGQVGKLVVVVVVVVVVLVFETGGAVQLQHPEVM
jgi:hypothetical protein